jgi:hypothetical protein
MPVYRHFYGGYMSNETLDYHGIVISDVESVNLTSDSITIVKYNGETNKYVNTNKQTVHLLSDLYFSELRSALINDWFSKLCE